MFFRRLAGILFCIVIGIIPVINNLFATYIAFSRMIKSRFLFLASALAVIICISLAKKIDDKEGEVTRIYIFEVQVQMADFKLRRWTNPADYNMSDSLYVLLNNATAQMAAYDPRMSKLLHNANEGHFDNPTMHAISKMCGDIRTFFPTRGQIEDGKNVRQQFEPTLNGDERAVISANAYRVITAYLDDQFFVKMTLLKIILFLGWIIGFVGSLRGRNMFTRNVNQPPGRNPTFEVDFNMANEARLVIIRGIDQEMAKGIVAERRKNGYFTDLADLATRMNFPQTLTESLLLTAIFSTDPNRRAVNDKPTDESGKDGKPLDNGRGRVIEF